jgi:hypothetical protein
MATTIKLKNGSGAPLAGDLVQGEPALDLTNKRLYTENASGTVIEVGTNPTSLTTGTFTSTGIDDNATSTAITIDSSQNVGVGTASPDGTFHVKDAIAQVYIQSNDGQPSQVVFGDVSDASGGMIEYTSSNEMTFKTNNLNERMRIDSSGDVFVKSGGQLKVERSGASNFSSFYTDTADSTIINNSWSNQKIVLTRDGNVGIGTTSPTAYTGQTNLNINSGAVSRIDFDISNSLQGYVISESGYLGVIANTSNFLMLGAGSLERMRIDSSGNVGIGESAPQYKLDINGANTAGNVDVAAFTNPVNAAGTGHGARILIHSTQNPSRGVGIASVSTSNYAADNAMAFYTSASSTLYERMRIDQYGNVSVRTTTGIGKLIGPRGNEVTVADDATVNLVINTAGACFIHAYDVGLGDGAVFFGTYKGGTTNIAAEGTHGWSTSDTDGNYCIYKSGNSHTITFKNRTGASRTMVFLVTAANTI